MARTSTALTSPVRQTSGKGVDAKRADELAVRAYLRVLAGVPLRIAHEVGTTEAQFIASVGRWAERTGVDRRTLSRFGVPNRVLDAAGVKRTLVADLIRPHYGMTPFSIADVTRRSGVSSASVRQTIYVDEAEGLIEAVGAKGKTVLYRRMR